MLTALNDSGNVVWAQSNVKDWWPCACADIREVRYTKSNGAVCVRLQCENCGRNIQEIKKFGIDVWSLPEWDESKRQSFRAMLQERNRNERIDWWARYNAYLQSDEWAKLRIEVFERDWYQCNECGDEFTANQLHGHHISYKGYNETGHSSIDEVITLCRDCHRKVHNQDNSEIYAGVMAI